MKTYVSQPLRAGRRIAGRAQNDPIRDPYHPREMLKEPTACHGCGAFYHHGRWQWGRKPEGAAEVLCPACRRIKDACPAGMLTIRGPVALQHKDEVIVLARKEEAAEMIEHPLNRIASIDQTETSLTISTTDIHLPRRIGETVRRVFEGKLVFSFDEGGYFLRAELT